MNRYYSLIPALYFLCFCNTLSSQPVSTSHLTASVSAISFTSTDAEKAAKYLSEILEVEVIEQTTSSLSDHQRWIRLPGDGPELRFTTALNKDELHLHYTRIKRFDLDMSIYTDWMDTHAALRLSDLNPVLSNLSSQGKSFLGPFQKEDGVYQIVVSIPGADYLRFESLTPIDKGLSSKLISWQELARKSRHQGSNVLEKSSAHGGEGGNPFDDTKHLVASDTISYISAQWYGWISKLKVGYRSGLEMTHGQDQGKIAQRYDLEKGELIIGATICKATILKPTKVSAMILSTNHGRKLEFGEMDRRHECYWVHIPPKHFVSGFFGRSEREIDQLGLIFSPIFQENGTSANDD